MENKKGSNLKKLRKQFGLNQTQIAKKIGVSQNSYSRYELGNAEPSYDCLVSLSKIFNVSIDYLLGNEENLTKNGVKIPVLGSIPAGIPIEAIEEVLDYEEIPKEWTTHGDFFGLKVKGNSMEPRICSGDVVIVRKQEDAESGDVCVVMVNGFDATLKQIKKEPNGLTLVPFNQKDYSPVFYNDEQVATLPVRIIGKVVELRGKF